MIADDTAILKRIRESGRGSATDHTRPRHATSPKQPGGSPPSSVVQAKSAVQKPHKGGNGKKAQAAAKPKKVKDLLASHALLKGLRNDEKEETRTKDVLGKDSNQTTTSHSSAQDDMVEEGYGLNGNRQRAKPWKPPLATYLDRDRQELMEINYKAYHELV